MKGINMTCSKCQGEPEFVVTQLSTKETMQLCNKHYQTWCAQLGTEILLLNKYTILYPTGKPVTSSLSNQEEVRKSE